METPASHSRMRAPASPRGDRRPGRPPRVCIEQILDAAIAIGLRDVTLRRVAQRLGVGAATLYRHISGRDELVRLASFRLALARQAASDDAHPPSHWAEVVCAYADSLVEVFAEQPQLIGELAAGRLAPETEIVFLEPFLAQLAECGVGTEAGMRLHNAVAMLAVGAAAGAAGARAAGGGARLVAGMERAVKAAGPRRYPHVMRGLHCYRTSERAHWRSALLPMLHGFAHERGEVLPAGLADADRKQPEAAREAETQEATS